MKRAGKASGKAAQSRRGPSARGKRGSAVKSEPASAKTALQDRLDRKTRELDEALQQQAAASEVLRLISTSPGDLQDIFAVILERATRLCRAHFGTLYLVEGEFCRAVAMHNAPKGFAELRRRQPLVPITGSTVLGRVAKSKRTIQVADLAAEVVSYNSPNERRFVKLSRVRSLVTVPMLKGRELIGVVTVYRQVVRPFTARQIALLEGFAAQAVIAIENTRLLNELRQRTNDLSEALDQQTATSEVLKVISASPGDLAPVFSALLANATRICDAKFGIMTLYEGGPFRAVALHNAPAEFAKARRDEALFWPDKTNPLARVAATKEIQHILDVREDESYLSGEQAAKIIVEQGGARSLIDIPMLKDGALLGVFGIYRQEVWPFSDKQIELLQNFAAQAVIAIENTRLLNELRQRTDDLAEALEQQTATSEVLKVISSAPGELQPVFEAILENATRICEANFGNLVLYDGEVFHRVALHNAPAAWAADRDRNPRRNREQAAVLYELVDTKEVVHHTDVVAEVPADNMHKFTGARTTLLVPMLKGGELIGGVGIYRQEVRPFADKQIALLKNFAAQAVIAIENARLLNELRQSLEQQTATADVLRVISSSPGDLQPVFEAVLENATRICEAKFGNLALLDGSVLRVVALHNAPPALAEARKREPVVTLKGSIAGVAISTRRLVHVADLAADEQNARSVLATAGGARTALVVPMFKEDEIIGTIAIYRHEVRPFNDKQIALLENFAAQAVIAIENARLLNELRESLEQQTATAEVLGVISSSPGDLEPVFAAMLENAARVCDAKSGNIFRWDGEFFHHVSAHNTPLAFSAARRVTGTYRPEPMTPLGQVAATKSVIHIADLSLHKGYIEQRYRRVVDAVELGHVRTALVVPMLKENELIGAFTMNREEVRPFTDKQIALVKNFASQAVIAIENTRLLSELRQSLEQQTATADVLQVISSSPGELEPVFQAMLENAIRICEAKFGQLYRFEGGAFHLAAGIDIPPDYAEFLKQRGAFLPPAGSQLDRAMRTKRASYTADMAADATPGSPAKLGGARSAVAVPMLKDNDLVGAIIIYRQEVRPFTDKQVELVENFAAQAVIAIENTRLLNELRQRTDDLAESLEQQTATSEVLKVISSSPGDLQSVFGALLENAVRICGAKFGALPLWEGDHFRIGALHNFPPAFAAALQRGPLRPSPRVPIGRMVATKQVVHVADIRLDQSYLDGDYLVVAGAEQGGYRTILAVPMLKEDELIGGIVIFRQEVRPFTDKQIELVQNFAAQAVIAIENTRLLNELRQSLEQQTATADVLKVISRSTFDLQTVLETLVESAARLCRAERASITMPGDGGYRRVASYGFTEEFKQLIDRRPLPIDRGNIVGRAVLGGTTVQVADVTADPEFTLAELSQLGQTRTILGVPMLRQGVPVGVLVLTRGVVEPFTESQIALVTTFADQAVIAIENVRLFEDVQQRTEELSDALEQQTATADVLKVISRSTFDLQTVLDTLAESAVRLCEADIASIHRQQGTSYQARATFSLPLDKVEARELAMANITFAPGRGSILGRTVLERKPVQVADVLADPDYTLQEMQKKVGFRTLLGVPLLRDGNPVGVIVLMRLAVKPFTDKQIELAQTFADQAGIAIENVRLFEEIQNKSRQVEEASRHKSQFLANMSHELRTPLNAILGYTELILDGIYGEAPGKMHSTLERVQSNGKHLLGLINDVLDLSKIEAGQLVLSIQDYSIKDVVHGVYSTVEPLASGKKLKFKIELPPDLPPARGDDRRLTQVLLNLVGNAIKFTDIGEVAVKAATANGSYTISVRDTGPGIAEADQAKIFDEFQQADSTQTKAKGGTGLGLAIAKRIVEMHGGRLWVESSVGHGSTFSFTVPLRVDRQAEPA